MKVSISEAHLREVEAHGESTYPNEGAGFILGKVQGEVAVVEAILPIANKRETEAQYNRYELTPDDYAHSELEAARKGIDLLGIFHSHPDHPARPSEFDRDHALPNFTYFITSVVKGKAEVTYAWRLQPDRASFDQDEIETALPANKS
jgi:proteasome lid subunit RPN8/RPN11